MTTKFKHKNQEFFTEVCNLLPSFANRFQEACEEQWDAPRDFIAIERDSYDTSFYWSFNIPKKDIKRVEELAPFVWYPASKWNGNPSNHLLVERSNRGTIRTFELMNHVLASETEFFMLAPKNKDIKPKC